MSLRKVLNLPNIVIQQKNSLLKSVAPPRSNTNKHGLQSLNKNTTRVSPSNRSECINNNPVIGNSIINIVNSPLNQNIATGSKTQINTENYTSLSNESRMA